VVTFEVTSTQDVTVNGIGLLSAGETVVLTDESIAHGYKISQANFPPYVQLTVAVTKEGEEV